MSYIDVTVLSTDSDFSHFTVNVHSKIATIIQFLKEKRSKLEKIVLFKDNTQLLPDKTFEELEITNGAVLHSFTSNIPENIA